MNAHFGNGFENTVKLPGSPVRPDVENTTVKRLAVSGGREAAEAYAASAADAENAGLRARAERGLAYSVDLIQALTAEIEMHRARILKEGGTRTRRKPRAESDVKLTRFEKVQCAIYIVMTFVALAVATSVVAYIVTESGKNDRLYDFLPALSYAFPIILAASGFAAWATLKDEDPVIEARTQLLMKFAFASFLLWAIVSSIVFVGQGTGLEEAPDILASVTLNDTGSLGGSDSSGFDWIETAYGIAGALFPSNTMGTFLLILHILSDVLLSGALTAKVIFMDRKTREMVPYQPEAAEKAQGEIASLERIRQSHVAEEAAFTDTLAQIDAVKQSHVNEVAALADSMINEVQAKRAAAIASVDAEFTK